MQDTQVGAVIRALRHRLGWTQKVLAREAGVSDSVVSDLERGRIERVSFGILRRVFAASGVTLRLDLGWRGAELDRLLDAGHAAIAEQTKRLLERDGWLVRSEVSYSIYGERGRVDLLAFHPTYRALLVIEIKTRIADVHGLLGSLDTKERLARAIARRFGWHPMAIVSSLVLAEDRTNRRRIAEHGALFSRFSLRGRAARAWLRKPTAGPEGIVFFANLPDSAHTGARRPGRQRVRMSKADASVAGRREAATRAGSVA
jgi:Helix-turn-helix.